MLKVFENILRRICGPKMKEGTGDWVNYIVERFIIYIIHHVLILLG
jgi:hypothetical protein